MKELAPAALSTFAFLEVSASWRVPVSAVRIAAVSFQVPKTSRSIIFARRRFSSLALWVAPSFRRRRLSPWWGRRTIAIGRRRSAPFALLALAFPLAFTFRLVLLSVTCSPGAVVTCSAFPSLGPLLAEDIARLDLTIAHGRKHLLLGTMNG